jgi:D-beta-D-heptose 7-phosphate kinase/D-beta-D-heptose 1-phosphate adenosyltransferase
VERISPEAPVPVFVPTHVEHRDGMAGNVYANLIALGCTANLLCGHTSKKTRLIDSRSKQQIVRIDEDVRSAAISFDTEIPDVYDAVVISDYNKGVVDYNLIMDIVLNVSCPVFIDTKKTDLECMQGAWVKINELEYSKIKNECSGVIVTRGANGSMCKSFGIDLPAPQVEVVDVTGAGDTYLAALTYQYLVTKDIKQAMEFAGRAASISVQHVGAYAPKLTEIV